MNYVEELKNYTGDKREKFDAFPVQGRAEIIGELIKSLMNFIANKQLDKAEKIYQRIDYFSGNNNLSTSIKKLF